MDLCLQYFERSNLFVAVLHLRQEICMLRNSSEFSCTKVKHKKITKCHLKFKHVLREAFFITETLNNMPYCIFD